MFEVTTGKSLVPWTLTLIVCVVEPLRSLVLNAPAALSVEFWTLSISCVIISAIMS